MKTAVLVLGGSLLLVGATAEARGHRGKAFGPGGHCARMLMRAHPDALKAKFGLDDRQLERIEKLRDNFFNKKLALRTQLKQQKMKLRKMMRRDLPEEQQVLEQMRKKRALRGKLMEEGVKTHLKVLRVLSRKQRAQLRAHCFEMRKGHGARCDGWGFRQGNKGWHGPKGRGKPQRPHGGPGPDWDESQN